MNLENEICKDYEWAIEKIHWVNDYESYLEYLIRTLERDRNTILTWCKYDENWNLITK